jgi:hypothetical protein
VRRINVFALYLFQGSDSILRFIASNREIDNWQDTAFNWLIAAVVISIVCVGLMVTIKFVIKQRAPNIKRRVWSRSRTVVFILVGFFPVLLATFFVWYLSRDFVNIVGVGGLLKGILFSWLLYTMLMLIWHSFGEWRRDIF